MWFRWDLRRDDPDARGVIERLSRTWLAWTREQKLVLIEAAEAIAQLEVATSGRRLTAADRQRYVHVAQQSVAAARLALNLCRQFPPPWSNRNEMAPIAEVIAQLLDFAASGANETALTDVNVGYLRVRRRLAEFRQQTPKSSGHASWELLGQLAWLVAGKRPDQPRNESTIRRYMAPRKIIYPPGVEQWRRAFPTLSAAIRAARAGGIEIAHRCAPAIRAFLRGGPAA